MENNVMANEIEVNGIVYVKKDFHEGAKKLDGLKYVIIRTYSAGVFAGYLEEKDGNEVILRNARRIWYWAGAATLSQLAEDGTTKPEECKFPKEVSRITLLETVEIIECSEKARLSIHSVAEWSA